MLNNTEDWREKNVKLCRIPLDLGDNTRCGDYTTISHCTLISVAVCMFHIQSNPVMTTSGYTTPRL
jgi:hypothetical protein